MLSTLPKVLRALLLFTKSPDNVSLATNSYKVLLSVLLCCCCCLLLLPSKVKMKYLHYTKHNRYFLFTLTCRAHGNHMHSICASHAHLPSKVKMKYLHYTKHSRYCLLTFNLKLIQSQIKKLYLQTFKVVDTAIGRALRSSAHC